MKKKERISSRLTFFQKYIFNIIWIGGFGYGTILTFYNGIDPKWIFLFLWIAGSSFGLWMLISLKYVSIDDNYLIISNYLKSTRVPLVDIEDVTENIFLNIHPVWITFKTQNMFGKKVMFMPKQKFLFFESHPIVDDLKYLAKSIRINENMSQ